LGETELSRGDEWQIVWLFFATSKYVAVVKMPNLCVKQI
jgi:hypothetical protein